MNKLLIATTLLIASLAISAEVFVQYKESSNGATLIRVMNDTPYPVYCFVQHEYGYFDFYINAHEASRWYYEPAGHYEWRCN